MLAQQPNGQPEVSSTLHPALPKRRIAHVTRARALAQHAQLDRQKPGCSGMYAQPNAHRKAKGRSSQRDWQLRHRASTTIARAVEDSLQDHEGGNQSVKEDHLFLAQTRTPLTKNGGEMLFQRVRKHARVTTKRISPHILRYTDRMLFGILIGKNDRCGQETFLVR